MARVWSEGFEMNDSVGYTTTGYISGVLVLDSNQYFYNTLASGISEGYFRMRLYFTSTISGGWVELYIKNGATTLATIRFTALSPITVSCNGMTDTGSFSLLELAWQEIEIHYKIDDTTGVLEINYEGTGIDCSVSGDTKVGTNSTFNQIYFFAVNSTGSNTKYIDDIALNDTAGGVDDSWCGDGRIIRLTPNDDVTTELTQFPALTDHHADVDEYPADGDTTYVQGTVVDEEDLYELSASGLVAADVDTINRVWVESRSKDTVASGGEVALFIVSDATEGTGADVVLSTTYNTKVMSQEFLQDPDGPAAWSVAALDALRAGVRTRA